MHLPASNGLLERRDGNGGGGGNNIAFIAVSVSVVLLITAIIISLYFIRGVRRKHYNPKYVPTKYLKQKWRDWTPRSIYRHVESQTDSNRNSRNINTAYSPTNTATNGQSGGGVDRNTSIRSIITLPGYTPAPRPTEQVLGREGERAGMDVVVEFPETADEEETRREDQMESLYQIRLARRQEIAERERRRQERREARARGDWDRLEELRIESRARAEALDPSNPANSSQTNLNAQAMITEHQARGRDRRVSSVTYASVGQVRHDGTRVRATSEDSERGPLLDSAAPMGGAGPSSLRSVFHHNRERSASSVLSMSTNASDEHGEHTPPSTSHNRSDSDPVTSPSIPRDTPADSDIGDSHIPHPLPPQYEQLEHEDAPPYESPVNTMAPRLPSIRIPRLPSLRTLPSIEVSSATPVNSTPATPASPTRSESPIRRVARDV